MSLFNFFNRKNDSLNGAIAVPNPSTLYEIPESVFVEKEKPQYSSTDENKGALPSENGINLLFQFLERNHESKGYDDALINPDNTHLEQNIEALKNDLERTIKKLKIYYEDFTREINFHIATRSRSGMVDTVEELTVKKETAESHIRQIHEIEKEAQNNLGVAQGVLISYSKGFRNGLAAISHHSIMKKNF
jgi:archaellum component FlaC